MATPAQAAAATVGAGSLAAAGAYGITQAVKGSEETTEEQTNTEDSTDPKPEVVLYLSTDNADGEYAKGLLTVSTNKEHLVKFKGNQDNNNSKWWDWAFENLWKNKNTDSDELFKDLQKGYSEDITPTKEIALNQACDAAYKKDFWDLKRNNQKLLKDIAAFCTSKDNLTLQLPSEPTIPNDEPSSSLTVFGETTAASTDYQGKILNLTRKTHLPSLVKTLDKTANETWWRWAYNKLYTPKKSTNTLDPLFQNLEEGFADKGNKALNQACNLAYKQPKTEYNKQGGFLIQNISDFCTKGTDSVDISEPEPKTFKNENVTESQSAYKDGILKQNGNKEKIVKATGDNNDLWWDWMFKKLGDNPFNDTSDTFKHVTQAYATSPQTSNETALNQACDAAYKKDKSALENETKKLFNEIKKFCTVGKDAAQLEELS